MAQQAVANYNNFSELAKLIETSRINTGLV